ncbi:MAG: hypothetical protein ABR587_09790 [Candidatus Binatia bacterium]
MSSVSSPNHAIPEGASRPAELSVGLWLCGQIGLGGANSTASLGCSLLRCSQASLKLMVTFLAVTERAALESALCASTRDAATRHTCQVTRDCLAALEHDPYFPVILERLLCSCLGLSAERYRGRCLFELANIWSREKRTLRGRDLVALLWLVAGHPCWLYRKLEAVIARRIEEGGRWALLDGSDHPLAS